MAETRSLAALNEKYNNLSCTSDQHEQEIRGIHQKIDAMTSALQTLTETMQGFTEAGNQWQQRNVSPATTQLDPLTAIPKSVRLEFPRFRGENPSGWGL